MVGRFSGLSNQASLRIEVVKGGQSLRGTLGRSFKLQTCWR